MKKFTDSNIRLIIEKLQEEYYDRHENNVKYYQQKISFLDSDSVTAKKEFKDRMIQEQMRMIRVIDFVTDLKKRFDM